MNKLLVWTCAADAYQQTDSEFLKMENNEHRDAGSTVLTATMVGNHLLVANVGDSRAVLCRSGKGNSGCYPISQQSLSSHGKDEEMALFLSFTFIYKSR